MIVHSYSLTWIWPIFQGIGFIEGFDKGGYPRVLLPENFLDGHKRNIQHPTKNKIHFKLCASRQKISFNKFQLFKNKIVK